jgi:energy-coupling factor transporter ATP-binding protein EcfA2
MTYFSHELGVDPKTGQSVILSPEARQLSLYIVGKAGMGKSKLLEHFACADMRTRDGLLYLDPHSDSAELLLSCAAAILLDQRGEQLIFWDPTDTERPFGLNPFYCPDPEQIGRQAGNFVAALGSLSEFANIFEQGAPHMKDVLYHMAFAFLSNQGYTLAETPLFLEDSTFRARFYAALDRLHPQVADYWRQVDKMRPQEQREFVRSTANKLRRFSLDPTMRHIFGQSTNSLDFRAIMDKGLKVIVKLPSEALGPDNAAFIGAFIVWEVYRAALSRADVPQAERRQFHLICDEFQTFMSTAFPLLITQCRKYGVDTVVAHQTRAQLTDVGTRQATLTVGNKVVFSVTGADAQELAKEFKIPPPEAVVSGQTQKYTFAPYPLRFIATHGHDDLDLLSEYRHFFTELEEFKLFMLGTPNTVGTLTTKFPIHHIGLSPEVLKLVMERFEKAVEEHLFAAMTVPQDIIPTELDHLPHMAAWRRVVPKFDMDYPKSREVIHTALEEMYAPLVRPTIGQQVYLALQILRRLHKEWLAEYYLVRKTYNEVYYRFLKEEGELFADRVDDYLRPDRDANSFRRPVWWHVKESNNTFGISDTEWETADKLLTWEKELLSAIARLSYALWRSPCYTHSGQLEPTYDKPRLYSDVQAEIANELSTLPPYKIRCSVIEKGQIVEHTLLRNKPVEQGLTMAAAISTFKANVVKMREMSRTIYGRDGEQVERAIRARVGALSDRMEYEEGEDDYRPEEK